MKKNYLNKRKKTTCRSFKRGNNPSTHILRLILNVIVFQSFFLMTLPQVELRCLMFCVLLKSCTLVLEAATNDSLHVCHLSPLWDR